MKTFDELLKGFDLNYFGNGKHKMPFEKALAGYDQGQVIILDVRTKEEVEMAKFGFALNIPTHEIPDRMNELPKDKTIAIMCVSGTRATMVSMYLQVNGYDQVKIIPESHSEIIGGIKPGFVLKRV